MTVDGRTCSQKFLRKWGSLRSSQDLSGAIGAAEYSGSFGAQYVQPLGSMMWFTELDVNFIDDYFMTGDLDSNDVQEGYEFVNIRTGLRGENWMLMLYGRNITDELTASGAADVPLARGSHSISRSRRSMGYSGGLGVLIKPFDRFDKGSLSRPFLLPAINDAFLIHF